MSVSASKLYLEHPEPCSVQGCTTIAKSYTRLCGSHLAKRGRTGDPLVSLVPFRNLKYKLPTQWLIDRYTADTPKDAIGSFRAALVSVAADPRHKQRDVAFELLSVTDEDDMIRTFSRLVVLSAISLYHADILPNDVCYHRQAGRQVVLMDRSRNCINAKFIRVRTTDCFGKLVVKACAGGLAKGVNELVDECPYWFR